jgi:hypothetical protein
MFISYKNYKLCYFVKYLVQILCLHTQVNTETIYIMSPKIRFMTEVQAIGPHVSIPTN